MTRMLLSLVAVLGTVLAIIAAPQWSCAAAGFGQPVPGRHIYDRAGVLTTTERANLETRAAAVQRAGAPVVVFLQLRDATYDATEQDARDVMNAWNVESRPGAKDGIVIFLNLKPTDPHHGQVALYAGQAQVRGGGHLPQRELSRIYQQVMLPLLKTGQTAAGIGAGLDGLAHSLVAGPPQPGPVQRAVAGIVRIPLNVLAVATLLVLTALSVRAWRRRPWAGVAVIPTTQPPNDLSPAFAGALVRGRIGSGQLEATILDLARRGALVIEPEGNRRVRLRLLDQSQLRDTVEERVWQALETVADADHVIPHTKLAQVRTQWQAAREALRHELLLRTWYDAQAPARRRPLYAAGAGALLLACLTFALVLIGEEIWGVLALSLFICAGIMEIVVAAALPETTPMGEQVAAIWRGYLAGLKAARHVLNGAVNLDEALPYAVAMGAPTVLNAQLKAASKSGYVPLWLHGTQDNAAWHGGFYPYWVAFHGGISPSSSGSSSGGSGAASGGAGAGGAF